MAKKKQKVDVSGMDDYFSDMRKAIRPEEARALGGQSLVDTLVEDMIELDCSMRKDPELARRVYKPWLQRQYAIYWLEMSETLREKFWRDWFEFEDSERARRRA